MDLFGGGGGLGPLDVVVAGKRLPASGLIILQMQLQGGAGTGTTGYYINPTTGAAPAAYVVPAATTFVIHAIRVHQINASSSSNLPQRLAYADTAGIDISLVNPVGAVSGVAGTNLNDTLTTPQIAGGEPCIKDVAMFGVVPTGKYPAIYQNVASFVSVVQVFGYEVV